MVAGGVATHRSWQPGQTSEHPPGHRQPTLPSDYQPGLPEGHWNHRPDLLLQVAEVATVSLFFDPTVATTCWRAIRNMAVTNSSTLPSYPDPPSDSLPVSALRPLIDPLCVAMVTIIKQSLGPDSVLLGKRLKLGRFLASLLLQLLARYPGLADMVVVGMVELLLSAHQLVYQVRQQELALRTKLEDNLLILVCNLL